jgi:hypothetical protein
VDFRSGEAVAEDAPEARRQAEEEDRDGATPPAAATGPADLPTRAGSSRRSPHKIRRMDDPEILQRVLAGLLTLP